MLKLIPFRMYNKIRNLGDSINPYVIEYVTKGEVVPVFSNKKDTPHLLGIGSIFFDASLSSHIWGSGIINKKNNLPKINPKNIHALRGKKTAELLMDLGYKIPDVPLGDPGVFAKNILDVEEWNYSKKYKACVIPHHASIDSPFFKKLRRNKDIVVLNMMTSDISILKIIAQSECVLSQSLHGLIFSEALGIPNLWISDKFDENWKFKFEDWFSTTLNPQKNPVSFEVPFSDMLKMSRLHSSIISRQDLIDAFPHKELVTGLQDNYKISHNHSEFFDLRVNNFPYKDSILNENTNKNEIEMLERKVKEGFAIANSFFSYPYYTFVNFGHSYNIGKLEKITNIMDKKHNFVFATLNFGKQPPKGVRVYNVDGFRVTKNMPVGDSFVIRPNGRILFGKEYLNFYLD
ncbi:polysaccharide pyruvyl transferase family protein [Vreelandella malpeensis]|uniref:Polysaccharide pyruvyl transferase family protein n=1 Tax=Vreelandella malpeensis TaxID=1172368 RepID=A0ABS8DU20_9GAMM|nr:polysaccharide pyruvyl transferase family protein [Halomonas malpeensis]MCB8889545.1 polysaccharide pyruvyl transferase family protein [Halomonas malpeensis]